MRLRTIELPPVAVALADDDRHRQERLQRVAHRHRSAARSAAPVRLAERLVQVVVDDVEAHVAGPRDPADGVQIGAVVVEERPSVVEDVGDLRDPLLEQAERRWVGQHQPGRRRADLGAQVVDVDVAAAVGAHVHQGEARHGHRGRVRPVRRVGDDHLAALLQLTAVGEVGPHQRQPGQLALRAGRRLQRDGVQPGHLGEHLLQPPHQLQRTLGAVIGLVRMQVAEAGQADHAAR